MPAWALVKPLGFTCLIPHSAQSARALHNGNTHYKFLPSGCLLLLLLILPLYFGGLILSYCLLSRGMMSPSSNGLSRSLIIDDTLGNNLKQTKK